jgi:hypothetical protein
MSRGRDFITTKLLEKHGAGCDSLVQFKKLWPRGVKPTPRALEKANDNRLNIEWAIYNLPPSIWPKESLDWLIKAEPFAAADELLCRMTSAHITTLIAVNPRLAAFFCDKARRKLNRTQRENLAKFWKELENAL